MAFTDAERLHAATLAIMRHSVVTASGGSAPTVTAKKDVNFYDYDGTLIAGYTVAEAQALLALPTAPDHSVDTTPLTFQEWNYTLAQVSATTSKLDVGATYITTDGKTKLHIRISALGRMTVPLYISQTVANGVAIDWGDGSATVTISGTGNVNTTHTYSAIGDYAISLTVASGCVLDFGNGTSSYCVFGTTGDNGVVCRNMIQSAHIGERVTSIGVYAFNNCYSLSSVTIPSGVTSIGAYAFNNCYSLSSVTIPSGVTNVYQSFQTCYSLARVVMPSSVTSIGLGVFYNCYSLSSVTIPSGVTSIGDGIFSGCSSLVSATIPSGCATGVGKTSFYNCYSLASVTIPSGVTSIGGMCFYNCYSLASVTIPSGVTSIGNSAFFGCYGLSSVTIPSSVASIGDSAFYNCYGMAVYDFSFYSSVPTLSATNAFTGIPSDCIMKIPSALYNTWKTAAYWSTYASYMVAV